MKKKILIISAHFPPSNLAGVHRSRLFAVHLPDFGWEPVILTVHEDYYEEPPDDGLVQLLPRNLRVEKVKAFSVTKPRVIGDIGLRAFFQLYQKAKHLIKEERFDFLYIPVPSFYTALLGRWLHASTGVPYGIDYIDPWVHRFPGSEGKFSRHWWSTKLASFLEPVAVKKACLITGVAPGYYEGVLFRNPGLHLTALAGAMPYGGEKADAEKIRQLKKRPFFFNDGAKCRLVYAGALLPKAFGLLESVCKAIAENRHLFTNVELYFIGTGKRAGDNQSFNVKPIAEKYSLWETVVFEHPARMAYLDVLAHLNAADGVFVLGSTERHYTPSKIYQAVLSGRPLFAVLHEGSSAVKIIRGSKAGLVLTFGDQFDTGQFEASFAQSFAGFQKTMQDFDPATVDQSVFAGYSAQAVTGQLAGLLDKVIETAGKKTQL